MQQSKRSFFISYLEGKKFSKISGDNNKIHLNKKIGYNSIFGENICHGALLIIKFFEVLKFKKILNKYSEFAIEVDFKKGVVYDNEIKVEFKNLKEKIYFFTLLQSKDIIATIKIILKKNHIYLLENFHKRKVYNQNVRQIKFYKNYQLDSCLCMLLCNLSSYVGVVYPGENSIIKRVTINCNSKFRYDKKINISSYRENQNLPLIRNILHFDKFLINFESLERPVLKVKFKKVNELLLKKIKNIKDNILIIGASSGIGNDLLNLFLNNTKIKIIATYFRNYIKIKKRNLIIKKINILTDSKLIFNIIKKYQPIIVYYFPTPKIFLDTNNKKIINQYKKYYLYYPAKILQYIKNFKVKFFYPSTDFININPKTDYSKIKLEAEKKLLKLVNKKVSVNILRLGKINTKQNLSLINNRNPNFRDLIKNNLGIQKKIFL